MNEELVEEVAKYIHDLTCVGGGDWKADQPTYGGIAWDTNYSLNHKVEMRVLARRMIERFGIVASTT